ncbi:hypothetical protein BKA70DRAFT_1226640 [Coprinopsis sp. MPI-PUGE-AT-0042]|nr:hypothetical protein BKA70DRAFT_1226640 [Coprinopsis sp. MPI-PUGE-AT-0042]
MLGFGFLPTVGTAATSPFHRRRRLERDPSTQLPHAQIQQVNRDAHIGANRDELDDSVCVRAQSAELLRVITYSLNTTPEPPHSHFLQLYYDTPARPELPPRQTTSSTGGEGLRDIGLDDTTGEEQHDNPKTPTSGAIIAPPQRRDAPPASLDIGLPGEPLSGIP